MSVGRREARPRGHGADLLLVTPRWSPNGGGRERYAAELVSHLAERGIEARVLCERVDSPVGASVRAVGTGRPGERRLAEAIRHARLDETGTPVLALAPAPGATHYQLHSGIHRDAFQAEREAMGATLRGAFHGLGMRLNARRRRLLRVEDELLFDRDVALMVFTPAQQSRLENGLRVPRSRIRCCRLGVDRSRFEPGRESAEDSPSAPGKLLFAGHNLLLKGLPAVLAAVARLRSEGAAIELTVAGGVPDSAVRRRTEALDLADSVRFLGAVDQSDLADLYRASDALVIDSYYDPAPRVVLEALACGCPVVASRRVGGSDLLRPGAEGEVIDTPSDVGQVAAALRRVLAPPRAERRRLAAALGAKYDFGSHVDEVEAWLWPSRSRS